MCTGDCGGRDRPVHIMDYTTTNEQTSKTMHIAYGWTFKARKRHDPNACTVVQVKPGEAHLLPTRARQSAHPRPLPCPGAARGLLGLAAAWLAGERWQGAASWPTGDRTLRTEVRAPWRSRS